MRKRPSNPVEGAYAALLSYYGPQGWWPLYDSHKGFLAYHPGNYLIPGSECGRVEVAFGAVLAQNTSWINAEKALINLITNDSLSVESILHLPETRLAIFLRPAGYYNQKAKKLKALSKFIKEEGKGKLSPLKKIPTQKLRDKMLNVWGCGPETVDSILLYALNKPSFVVDAYTRRISARMGWTSEDASYNDLKEKFETNLPPKDAEIYKEYHALIVEHAKRHCTKTRPKCQNCPLKEKCEYNNA
ncbi:G/T mismatches repair enzyme [uncultured archaeon]|nr:G/T mismatches repair enzyme [uncultured archaeon]